MKKNKKLLIVLAVVLVIAIFVIINLTKGSGGEIAVTAEKVQRGDITQVVSGPGRVQPEVEVKISANVSAEIVGLYVKEGERVAKGQLLVELDRTKYLAAVDRAKSTKKAAEARLIKACNDYQRAQQLYEKKLSSLAQLENSEADLKLAESDLEQSIASLKQAEDDLAKTRLFSPRDGIVTKVNKEVGEIALGSMFQADVIMVVSDLSKMEVMAEVDENDIVLVSKADTTDIEVDALPDTILRGVVSEIAHTATTRGRGTQEEVTNFEVKITILDQIEKLRPGMSATVDIRTETRNNVLMVPIQAVAVRERSEVFQTVEKSADSAEADADKDSDSQQEKSPVKRDEMIEVLFIVEDGVAKLVAVETGISSDTHIEVKKGVTEGQQVVTGSYRVLSKTLKNGDRVKLTSSASLAAEKAD
ncbi:MAG TPA: efflux RND transporter periplasmic adaptor subunit [bacterium]|nr:efflux RND transporter periplasmic adaptor subunit [bacterium]